MNGLVTGAGRGIGQAVAERLQAEGNTVAIVDKELERGRFAVELEGDLSDRGALAQIATAVLDQLGSVDFLVNNAGVRHVEPVVETTESIWDETLAVNLTAPFLLTRAFVPCMIERGFGRIVNISSGAGQLASSYRSAYCASKAGIEGLSRAFAVELGRFGITSNTVAPGPIRTPLTATNQRSNEIHTALVASTPAARWGEPHEIAAAVAFLVRPEAAYVNGVTIAVDGGWAASKDFEVSNRPRPTHT